MFLEKKIITMVYVEMHMHGFKAIYQDDSSMSHIIMYNLLLSVAFPRVHKNIKRHTVDTFVSWPNPKQWVIVHTSDLMMIIRQSLYILSISTTEMGKLKTYSPTYCIMNNGENMLLFTHTLDKIYLTDILYVQCHLRPPLFLIYINDLSNVCDHIMAFLFADDMHLFLCLIAQFMHKVYTADVVPEFQNMFIRSSDIHSRQTRQFNHLNIPLCHKNILRYRGAIILKKCLKSEIPLDQSNILFKQQLGKHIVPGSIRDKLH